MSSPVKVLVVYTSTFGNTKSMAESVTEGAKSVKGASVVLKEALEANKNDVRQCDALILGSPVRHRTPAVHVKVFIENVCEYLWLADEMVANVGSVFTAGGGYGDCGAGAELAQLSRLAAMAASGIVLVTLPKTTPGFRAAGMDWGPHGRSGQGSIKVLTHILADTLALPFSMTHFRWGTRITRQRQFPAARGAG